VKQKIITKDKIEKTNKKNKFVLLDKINENKIVILLFIIATIFFIYQHAGYSSWDFEAYVLNGKYWFSGGKYFEIFRPPLMSLMLGIFSFISWKFSEFIFIIVVSSLFAYSSVKFAKSVNFNPAVFYGLSLNVYILNQGLINGTELLSLVFLELFIVFLLENKYFSGFVLGLSVLSRYTNLAFLPLIFLHMNLKQIIKSLTLLGLVISIWLTYNFYMFGNFFTSIADQYANNILYRSYAVQTIQLNHFLQVQNILIPLFLLGFILTLIKIFKKIKEMKKLHITSFLNTIDKLKIEIIMLFFLVYSILSYTNIPSKNVRYLFNLALPTIYFSYIGLDYLVNKIVKIKINKIKTSKTLMMVAVCVIVIISFIMAINYSQDFDPPQVYNSAINKLNELNISNCSMESNSWVKLNYYGLQTEPLKRMQLINKSIYDGKLVVLFKHRGENVYNASFISSSFLIFENDEYVIMGYGECKFATEYKESYLQQTDYAIFQTRGYHINTNSCFILFHNHLFLEKTCNFVNFNKFKQDEYRVLE